MHIVSPTHPHKQVTMVSSLPFILFCFTLQLFSISDAIVPTADTFRYVNEGEFWLFETEYAPPEYNPSYRSLPPFTFPFQLCFYNTTPNAYTLALRMGIRRDQTMMRWVWEANRGNPVGENATLSLGSDGNLVLSDADGRIAWQTNTANKGVVGFAILSDGNIVLRDSNGGFVWQSFDSPTDTLLLGQSLRIGGPTTLVSRASPTNNVNGVYKFVLEPKRLAMYYKNMRYWSSPLLSLTPNENIVNATLQIGESEYSENDFNTLRCYPTNAEGQPLLHLGILAYNSTLSYLRLGIDGNLRFYSYRRSVRGSTSWTLLFTLFDRRVIERPDVFVDECQLPGRCGEFGLCENSQCVGCPTPNGVFAWSKDCKSKSPSCKAGDFGYYQLKGVDHFTVKYTSGSGPVKRGDCEKMCTKDCKCLGYSYHTDRSRCWIAYELKTLTRVGNSTNLAYIKTPIQ